MSNDRTMLGECIYKTIVRLGNSRLDREKEKDLRERLRILSIKYLEVYNICFDVIDYQRKREQFIGLGGFSENGNQKKLTEREMDDKHMDYLFSRLRIVKPEQHERAMNDVRRAQERYQGIYGEKYIYNFPETG